MRRSIHIPGRSRSPPDPIPQRDVRSIFFRGLRLRSGSALPKLNGFGFTAASTASITSVTVATARGFTGFDKAGYFSDGNVVHAERVAGQPGSAQVYVDANQSGSFEAASDLVIHLDHLAQGLVRSDFQFH